jgi:hypothetical protein
MPHRSTLYLLSAVLAAGLADSACTNDCPNCPGDPASVTVSPGVASVLPAHEVQLVALIYDDRGYLLSGHGVTWSSDDQAVATVDANGLVSGVAGGDATISAKVSGKSGGGTVHVVTVSTLSAQVQPILTNSCALAGCHLVPGPPPAMTSAAVSYASIVTSGNYVTPGDSTVGLLLTRLKSTTSPMPPGTQPLSELQPGNYDLIALWIQLGAQNN